MTDQEQTERGASTVCEELERRLSKAVAMGRHAIVGIEQADLQRIIAQLRDDIERGTAELQAIKAQIANEHAIGTVEHARQHVGCGVVIAAKETELGRVTAENQRHWEYAKTVPGLIEEACAVARSEAEAERDAMREVVEAAEGFWDHFEHGQPGTPGTAYPMTYEQLDAWHDEYDRWLAILGSAVTARFDATRKATADATEEGK